MTLGDWIVVLLCFALGYWLIAVYLPGMRRLPEELDHDHADAGAARPWHETLGLAPTATVADITAAYRTLAAPYQPDRLAHLDDAARARAPQRLAELDAAYADGLEARAGDAVRRPL